MTRTLARLAWLLTVSALPVAFARQALAQPATGESPGDGTTRDVSSLLDAHVLIGAERLFGAGGEATSTGAGVHTDLGAPGAQGGMRAPFDFDAPPAAMPLRAPRLGVDVVLDRRFTLGLAGIAWYGESEPSFSLDSHRKTVLFGGAPRVGYLVAGGKRVSAWLRVAVPITYGVSTQTSYVFDGPSEGLVQRYAHVGLALEPTVVVEIVRGFAVTATIDLDIPLVGQTWATSDASFNPLPAATHYSVAGAGVTLGLLSWL
jgi:hypothetical protein